MLNYLTIVEGISFSPYLLTAMFSAIIFGQLGSLKRILRATKYLSKKVVIALAIYIGVRLLLSGVYSQVIIPIEYSLALSVINLGIFVYLSAILLSFTKRNLKTFKNWYYLIPVMTLLVSKIIEHLL